jgi:hypothetical protein
VIPQAGQSLRGYSDDEVEIRMCIMRTETYRALMVAAYSAFCMTWITVAWAMLIGAP